MHNITSSSAKTADTGNTPPERAFPKIKTSGRASSKSQAIILPVRAIPVCTSSAINKTLYFVHKALTPAKYPSSGTTTPASP